MISKLFFLAVVMFLLLGYPSQENGKYQREYYPSGKIKSEGWLRNGTKTAFWKQYYPNGKTSAEGHYENDKKQKYWHFYTKAGKPEREGHFDNGQMTDWWLFYDNNGKINHKCQLRNGKKDGYCLKYRDEELVSAEKYNKGEKIKEWTSFSSFRRENSLSDLK